MATKPTKSTKSIKVKTLTKFIALATTSFTSLLIASNSANAALTAVTANTIHGTAPYLVLSDNVTKLTNLNELLGFTMPDGSGGTTQINAGTTTLTAPTGMKFSDVKLAVTANNVANAITNATVGDDDGDAAIAANTSVTGSILAVWKDNGTVVTNLNDTLTSCGGPYTLEVSIPTAVSANTTYGQPKTNSYGTSPTITYTFLANGQGICYVKPKDMTSYGTPASVFEVGKGFKANAGFPTTGFNKAVFSLIGSGGDQKNYR